MKPRGLRRLCAALLVAALALASPVTAQSGGSFGGSVGESSSSSGSSFSDVESPGAAPAASSGASSSSTASPDDSVPDWLVEVIFWLVIAGLAVFLLVSLWQLALSLFVPRQVVFVQLLLARSPKVQRRIGEIARSADADTAGRLPEMFRQAVRATLDASPDWVYGHAVVERGRSGVMTRRLAALAVLARAAFTVETTHNQQDGREDGPQLQADTSRRGHGAQADGAPQYLAVSLGAVTTRRLPVPPGPQTAEGLRAVLEALAERGNIEEVQVIWSPDTPGEFLTEDQAIGKYPDLGRL